MSCEYGAVESVREPLTGDVITAAAAAAAAAAGAAVDADDEHVADLPAAHLVDADVRFL